MKITVLSATTTTVPTAKGSYQKLELAFKGEDGQVKGKNIMSFGATASTFKVLSKAQGGEVYDITAIKNEASGYWDWTGAERSTGETGQSAITPIPSPAASKSTYETAEERAKRQVYIVRQSSLSAAINYIGDTKKVSTEDVIAVAKQFEAYVFSVGESPKAAYTADEFKDDIPY